MRVTQRMIVRLDGIQQALPESVKPPLGRDAGAARPAGVRPVCALVLNAVARDLLLAAEERFPW